ncbi:MAG: hypothetical protein ACAI44_18390 [Candidatus Sericytochromatia bacterium]
MKPRLPEKPLILGLLLALGLSAPDPALACACCAEANDHVTRQATIDPDIRSGLGQLRLNGKLDLEGPEPAVPFGPFTSTARFEGKAMVISLSKDGKPAGTLLFQLPAAYSEFQAHLSWLLPPDLYKSWAQSDTSLDAPLYKELRLQGTLVAAPASAGKWQFGKTATLILSGHGNRCFAAEAYAHWRLEFEVRKGSASEKVLGLGQIVSLP